MMGILVGAEGRLVKINRFGGEGLRPERVAHQEDAGRASDSELFRSLLDEAEGGQQRATLERLLQEVNQKGELLVSTQSLDAAYAYRQAVKQYLAILVKGSFGVSSKYSTDRLGRQRVFAVVQEIDKRLIDLLNIAVADQNEPLQMLRIVGEVKGLLISLQI